MTGSVTANALPAPALVSPAAGATFSIYPRETALVWAAIPGAASYVVEWDYKGGDTWASEQRGTSGVMIRSSEPKASLNFIGAQPGRWRVWAIDSQGAEGARSEWRELLHRFNVSARNRAYLPGPAPRIHFLVSGVFAPNNRIDASSGAQEKSIAPAVHLAIVLPFAV